MSWLLKGLMIGAAVGLAAVAVIGTGGLAAAAIVGGLAAGGAGLGEVLSTMSWAPKEVVGQIATGSLNVCISKRRAARAHLDSAICSKHSGGVLIATGSDSVLINGWPAARVDDKTACSAVITRGTSHVLIGGGSVQTDDIRPEHLVPTFVHVALLVVGLGSAVILAGPIVAIVGLAGGLFGGFLGESIGGKLFGEGSDGQKWSMLVGSLLGGLAGSKGGAMLANKFVPAPATTTQAFMRGGLPSVQKFVGPRTSGGGAFPTANTEPYDPVASGKLLVGQNNDASCLAGSCKMLLNDEGIPEAYLRMALKIDENGGFMSDAPAALEQFCMPDGKYHPKMSLTELQAATSKGSVIVSVESPIAPNGAHAIVVDGFENGFVLIRDPWPPGVGSAYKLPISDFKAAFFAAASKIAAASKNPDPFTGKVVTIP
jgi:uncharacterized Zn-binding protein involved in type VI secretion